MFYLPVILRKLSACELHLYRRDTRSEGSNTEEAKEGPRMSESNPSRSEQGRALQERLFKGEISGAVEASHMQRQHLDNWQRVRG